MRLASDSGARRSSAGAWADCGAQVWCWWASFNEEEGEEGKKRREKVGSSEVRSSERRKPQGHEFSRMDEEY